MRRPPEFGRAKASAAASASRTSPLQSADAAGNVPHGGTGRIPGFSRGGFDFVEVVVRGFHGNWGVTW
jgi:hypothetical protein